MKPVVKMFPSLVKMALIGRIPSCGARRSCAGQQQDPIVCCRGCETTARRPPSTHRHHLPLAGVAHAQTAVLAGGAEQAAVPVPADAVDEVRVVVHGDEGLARPHVPDYDQVVTAWREKDAPRERSRPPSGLGHLPAVRSMLRAVGCQVTMPTRLECPSSTTMGSEMGRVSV